MSATNSDQTHQSALSYASSVLSAAMTTLNSIGDNSPLERAVSALNYGIRAATASHNSPQHYDMLDTLADTVDELLQSHVPDNVISFTNSLNAISDNISITQTYFDSVPEAVEVAFKLSDEDITQILALAAARVKLRTDTDLNVEPFIPSTGLWLRNARLSSDYTQTDLAYILASQPDYEGYSTKTLSNLVSNWERNVVQMTRSDVISLAILLEVEIPQAREVRYFVPGERLQALREFLGMSREEFGLLFDLAGRSVGHYENGLIINPEWLTEASKLFGEKMADALAV